MTYVSTVTNLCLFGKRRLTWLNPVQESTFRLLLEYLADVNAVDKFGYTALWYACKCEEFPSQPLVAKGPQFEATKARIVGDKSTEKVRLLLEYGAHVNATDKLGCTALMNASERGHDSLIRLLLANQADVNAVGRSNQAPGSPLSCFTATAECGYTALLAAIHGCHESTIRLLLENSADVNATFGSNSALMCAICLSELNYRSLRLLLEFRADVNATDERGWTALMFAVRVNDIGCVRLLLEYEADVNATDKLGCTARMHASQRVSILGDDSMMQLLLDPKNAKEKKAHAGLPALLPEKCSKAGIDHVPVVMSTLAVPKVEPARQKFAKASATVCSSGGQACSKKKQKASK